MYTVVVTGAVRIVQPLLAVPLTHACTDDATLKLIVPTPPPAGKLAVLSGVSRKSLLLSATSPPPFNPPVQVAAVPL